MYSLKIAGGLVLAFRGFQALNRGLFFEVDMQQRLQDLSIVPLASPLIAGPATLTAAISFPSKYGMVVTFFSLTIAIVINLIIMLNTRVISASLRKHNIMGSLIRITGLIVAAIGIQMIADGGADYFRFL